MLAFGVKESMSLNNLFTVVNMAVVLFVIVAGAFKGTNSISYFSWSFSKNLEMLQDHIGNLFCVAADISNWQIDKASLPEGQGGDGGFFPYGVMGVLRGAATCFYGFIGFDCVATTGQ